MWAKRCVVHYGEKRVEQVRNVVGSGGAVLWVVSADDTCVCESGFEDVSEQCGIAGLCHRGPSLCVEMNFEEYIVLEIVYYCR